MCGFLFFLFVCFVLFVVVVCLFVCFYFGCFVGGGGSFPRKISVLSQTSKMGCKLKRSTVTKRTRDVLNYLNNKSK